MKTLTLIAVLFFTTCAQVFAQQQPIPSLVGKGTSTQLIVHGKPYLLLGGELGNSTASDPAALRQYWKRFQELNLNTILVPVYWELIEPEEGKFDFSLLDTVLVNARKYKLKVILLWFGAWKNSMSCYVPGWVKKDDERFPRARTKEGRSQEILTAFSRANLESDKKAFLALMEYLKKADSKHHTVIMVQVENEIGSIPDARDYHPLAETAFQAPVPSELLKRLQELRENKTLSTHIDTLWRTSGYKTYGTWKEIFGENVYTDELFMAWYYATYVEELAQAGKAVYALPMFVNAALPRLGRKPGQYPGAGPLPHLMEVWQTAAPHIDMLSPDIYFPDFERWCTLYTQRENPLFIPEARNSHEAAANVFYAIGHAHALGFSPFAIEHVDPQNGRLAQAYSILAQLTPVILEHKGKPTMDAVLLTKDHPVDTISFGEYTMVASYEPNDPYARKPLEEDAKGACLVIQLSTDEFLVAGSGVILTFHSNVASKPNAGILSIDEGRYEKGKWISGRRLNGDESHQGRHTRLPYFEFKIHNVKLYQYH